MKLTFSNNFFYQLLYVLCIAIPYLNHFELTLFVWAFTFAISVTNKYSYSFLKLIIPFIVILIIAFVMMLFNKYQTYFIVRDVTYLLKPVMGLFIGYQMYQRNLNNVFKLVIYAAVFVAVSHLAILLHAVIFYGANTVNEIRDFSGFFSDYEVYAVIILLFHEKFELGFSRKKTLFFTYIIGFSAFMYLARTNFIQFVILFLAMKGFLKINKTSVTCCTCSRVDHSISIKSGV